MDCDQNLLWPLFGNLNICSLLVGGDDWISQFDYSLHFSIYKQNSRKEIKVGSRMIWRHEFFIACKELTILKSILTHFGSYQIIFIIHGEDLGSIMIGLILCLIVQCLPKTISRNFFHIFLRLVELRGPVNLLWLVAIIVWNITIWAV